MNLIVATSNTSARAYQQDQTIHEFFEKQAQLTPDQIAISYKNQKLSYLELNCESNKLARYLQNQCLIPPLVPGTLIALYVEPSLEMVIGLLGILKAGCAYVPIDIHYPSERVRYMLEDTGCPIVLTKSHLMEHLHSYTKRSVLLDEKPYEHEKSLNLLQQSQASDLAYVIYTSGTTGQPKGVMITHKSVNNYNIWMNSHSCFQQAEIVDCSSSISFDATVNVLLSPLVSGKNVILGETYIKQDPCLYINYLEQFMVNLIKVTPSYFSNLLNILA